MTKQPLLALILTAALISGAGIWTANAQNAPGSGTRAVTAAVVDVADAINNLRAIQRLRAEIEADRARLTTEQQNRQNELRSLQDELQLMAQGTPAFNAKVAQIEQRSLDFQIWREVQGAQINQKILAANESAYRQLLRAISDYARANRIDMVFFKERPFTMSEDPRPEELGARIQNRKLLYASEDLDITREIVQIMNR